MSSKLNSKSILEILDCDLSDFDGNSSDDEDRNIQEDILYKGIYFYLIF